MKTDSLLGKQIDEYRIETALGAGGMARVYRALDVKLRRYIALGYETFILDVPSDPEDLEHINTAFNRAQLAVAV